MELAPAAKCTDTKPDTFSPYQLLLFCEQDLQDKASLLNHAVWVMSVC